MKRMKVGQIHHKRTILNTDQEDPRLSTNESDRLKANGRVNDFELGVDADYKP